MFDTHCHLNFNRFSHTLTEVIARARQTGISAIVVPGTDESSSRRAVEIARIYPDVHAAVGIHPHHLFELFSSGKADDVPELMAKIGRLADEEHVVAVGEVGIDRHVYEATKYVSYAVPGEFVLLQRKILAGQLELAATKHKSLILHNREAKEDLLDVLSASWSANLAGRTVFHCCEPDLELLEYAKSHNIYIGVDGDVTYDGKKQEFVKQIPIDLLVLETDAPYLLPEPLRSEKKYPNEPAYITYTAETVARLKGCPVEEIKSRTEANARLLFALPEYKGKNDRGDKPASV